MPTIVCGDCEHWRDHGSCWVNLGAAHSDDAACGLFSHKSRANESLPVEAKLMSELAHLLRKYNATILRSSNSSNDLVISIQVSPSEAKEFVFAEEISEVYILNERFS